MNYKKILFISPNLGRGGGGAERQIVTVACLLKDGGYKVEFLCYAEGDFYAHILNDNQIPIRWLIYPNYFRRLFGVRRFIRKGKYDAVISFLETPNFLNNFAAIGGKNHAPVLHACKAISNLIETDKTFKHQIEEIEHRVLSR